MANITSFEMLDEQIKKTGGKPKVLEALWDGNTEGWFLCLFLYTETRFFFIKKIERHSLGTITLGNDLRFFNGEGLAEIPLAKELGKKAIEKYKLEFYFPSDKNPDNNCPIWTERHRAINCADCKKLIIPANSPHLPKDVCYNCHLTRESNEKIIRNKPYDEGVSIYLFKDGQYRSVFYSTHFDDADIAPFVQEKVNANGQKTGVNVVTLEREDIIKLVEDLEQKLDQKLKTYSKPVIDEEKKRFIKTHTREYKGKEYELCNRFYDDHSQISNLIHSYNTAIEAISQNFVYKIFFKKGITYRDDTILRFVKYVQKEQSTINAIQERYKNILTEREIVDTLTKLSEIGCLIIDADQVSITGTGKKII